jgi:plasmid stabilization system protein ParE
MASSSRRLRIHEFARADVHKILIWISNRSPQGAAIWRKTFEDAVAKLLAAPEQYPAAGESSSRWKRNIRQAIFKTKQGRPYRILFETGEDEVRILRVRGPGQPPLRPRQIPH